MKISIQRDSKVTNSTYIFEEKSINGIKLIVQILK